MKKLLLPLAIIAAALVAHAQPSSGGSKQVIGAQTVAEAGPTNAAGRAGFDLSIDNIMRGPALYGWEPDQLRWTPDGSKLFFSWKQNTDPLEKDRDTYVVNRDGSGLRKLSDEEKKDAMPANGDRTRDRRRILYAEDGDLYLWDAATGKRHALTRTNDAESAPRFTFDEKRVTFIRANNVYAIDLQSGEVAQITNVAGPEEKGPNVTMWDDKKGTASQEFVKAEELRLEDVLARRTKKKEEDEAKKKREHPLKPFKLAKGQMVSDARLSPDGKYVVMVVVSEPEKAKRTIVPSYVTESAYTETIPGREKVGDLQPTSRIAVMDESNGEVKWFEHGLAAVTPAAKQQPAAEKPSEREVSMRMPLWSEDGKHAFVVVRSADNKDLWIQAFDAAAPKGRTIVTEHDDAWIRWAELTPSAGWIDDNTIYYASEATGYMHLNVVPFVGGASKALTSGKWEVDAAVLSPDRKTFYLTTSEVSPFERHLYSLPAGGGTPRKLTTRVGLNHAVVSPDGAVIANVYSYNNKPPELYVASAAGDKRITTSPASDFFSYPWIDAPIVMVPARDGVNVPAHIYVPPHPTGKAVVFVHGAGYLQNVTRGWSEYPHEYMFHHFLMNHGYIVLDLDYRGSRGYGRDWRTAIYRHMGGKDLDDQVDAAHWLVKEHGVDAKRIGIYGGSYGGFTTLMAMFTQPDVFAAGAALRPVTDWAHYNHSYTSDILNEPQNDAEAYRKSSPIYFADGLKGHLLICHGMIDTNVQFQDTVRLVQRLIELRKTNWELAVFPMENHGFVEPTSWADEYKRIFKLFEDTIGR